MSKIIRTKLISKYYKALIANYFKSNKTKELVTQKYY